MKNPILPALTLISLSFTAIQGGTFFDGASSSHVWDHSTTSNWGNSSGGPYNQTWSAWGEATFEGTGAAITVSNSNQPNVNKINFTSDGYVLNGGQIVMGNPGGINNFNVTGTNTATINSNISQTYATGIQKIGTGTLILGGTVTSNAGNNRIEGGTLQIAAGSFAGSLYIADSSGTQGTLRITGGTVNSWMTIGTRGKGIVNVEGGVLNLTALSMGHPAASSATNPAINSVAFWR